MMRTKVFVGAVAALAVSAYAAGLNSGLNKGESVTPFHPEHVSGPLANSTKCFPCTFQARPQVQVWVNGDDHQNVLAIAKTLDKAMADNKSKEFKAMMVFVVAPDKVAETKAKIATASKGVGNNVALSVLSKNDSAVAAYKFNTSAEVKNTVFAYKNWKVMDKMVNLKADEKGIKALNGAIASL